MDPKVTVILPTLNMKAYIHQSLKSVLDQTLKEIEVFVVDAASTDGTREIVREYMENDSRVFLLDDVKKSTGYAKNIGIEMSSAPYIAMVEPDDYIELDMMEKLYQAAEETGAGRPGNQFNSEAKRLLFRASFGLRCLAVSVCFQLPDSASPLVSGGTRDPLSAIWILQYDCGLSRVHVELRHF